MLVKCPHRLPRLSFIFHSLHTHGGCLWCSVPFKGSEATPTTATTIIVGRSFIIWDSFRKKQFHAQRNQWECKWIIYGERCETTKFCVSGATEVFSQACRLVGSTVGMHSLLWTNSLCPNLCTKARLQFFFLYHNKGNQNLFILKTPCYGLNCVPTPTSNVYVEDVTPNILEFECIWK